jgi:ABC-2 type transport system ATP-binding protein
MIEVKNLTRNFGQLVAVNTLNFSVREGEVFGLLGPNGAGKSTTLSMLCTILKPSSGTATINGTDVTRHPAQVRRMIGIVFQDPSIDDRLTGRENLEMHANLYDVPRADVRRRIDEVLELVELKDKADLLMRTYSGGMRRRLEIARGLIHYPKVLFLDEPTIGLDPQTREHIWTYVSALSRREKITVVLTTHYMEEADELCERIAIIDYGKIIALDTPGRLKDALEGDRISIKTEGAYALAEKLNQLNLAKDVKSSNDEVKLVAKNGGALLPRIVELAANLGIRIESMSMREPTLEDVFLHFTGREIRSEGGEELHGLAAIKRRGIR